jgi:superfamily II DNA/RNA helicase
MTWVVQSLSEADRQAAGSVVGQSLLSEIGYEPPERPHSFEFTAQAYGFAVSALFDEAAAPGELRATAELAFETFRASARPTAGEEGALHLLHTACYGVLADRTPDVARFLRGAVLPDTPPPHLQWGDRARGSAYRLWLLLLRKEGWADLDAVQQEVVSLRRAQSEAEEQFLGSTASPRTSAWELIVVYHLARAAEILAIFTAQGSVGGGFDVREQLQGQFDRSISACERAELLELHATVKLLAATAERMVANSIWTVTRAVNSRVTRFVQQLVSRSQQRPIFEMLPPQRIALREKGLLGSGHRAVVVSLPTSSGKTFIAQFRILQALNQFEADGGWVAYIAPTRALVNQVCAKLRRDFGPLGVVVERVSPALEIDGVEAELLSETDPKDAFRVLVGTPEKIDLLLRGGWEEKIGRPLTLVVVDEAHNIADAERGLKLELLLATINRECRQSQFLLLTPFVENAEEVARWLSPDSHDDLSVEYDWRPNDRAIVIAQPARGEKAGDFSLELKTVHTSRNTIEVEGEIELCSGRELGLNWSRVRNSQSNVAAVAASCLSPRGTVIVVAGKVPHTWGIARTLSGRPNSESAPRRSDADLNFVADFVAREFGSEFELVDLIKKRIGVHHSGLSEEIRVLMEWLVERGELDTLVATTTIAQGVNFPVTGVVLAAHQYPYGKDMPPEDFWNLAGRAGRADQVGTGIIALAATNDEKAALLREYVVRNVSHLNSTLIKMVGDALSPGQPLELQTLYWKKEWSAFLQYLAHSYRQIGDHSSFANQIEQVLRGSFGFQKLRQQDVNAANKLVSAVHEYALIIRGKPLALVDSTGFSWESVSRALSAVGEARIGPDAWDPDRLFAARDTTLERAFGVLFKVPEIKHELAEITGGKGRDGNLLARIVKDWVAGASIPDLATEYFADVQDPTEAITQASRAVHGKIAMTASWGISALQSLTAGDQVERMSDDERRVFRNLPSRIFYGVNSDEAIDLRLLGVPRKAAQPLADALAAAGTGKGVKNMRDALNRMDDAAWRGAIGAGGDTYRRAWKVLEGLE